jgi:hypothetical protein
MHSYIKSVTESAGCGVTFHYCDGTLLYLSVYIIIYKPGDTMIGHILKDIMPAPLVPLPRRGLSDCCMSWKSPASPQQYKGASSPGMNYCNPIKQHSTLFNPGTIQSDSVTPKLLKDKFEEKRHVLSTPSLKEPGEGKATEGDGRFFHTMYVVPLCH